MQRLLKRRFCTGLGLFSALLALGLLGMLLVAAVGVFETWRFDNRSRVAARQLTALAEAVGAFVNGRFPALLTTASNSPFELTLAELRNGNVLPAGFPETDALGRGYRILVLADGPRAIRALVTQTLPPGDSAMPAAALLQNAGDARMGIVFPDRASRIAGPLIDADVADFQGAFAGQPAVGAVAALMRFDHQTVFGDQLYRVAITGFADANRMATDLDLGGNAIANAGLVEAGSIAVSNDLTAGGNFEVDGDLVVGQSLRVARSARIAGAASAESGAVTGALSADSISVENSVHARTVSAEQSVTAESIGAESEIVAGTARLTTLLSSHVSAANIAANQISASEATAGIVQASGRISAPTAGFSRLTVGSCSGC